MKAEYKGIARTPESDGGHQICIRIDDREDAIVTIPPDMVIFMLRTLQDAAVQRARDAQKVAFPTMEVDDAHTAHQGANAELMVANALGGLTTLIANDRALLKMRAEIDRVLAYRSTASTRQ